MSDFILTLSTKDGCGACLYFKANVWNSLRAKIDAQRKVTIIEVNYPLPTGKAVPDALIKTNIDWFPSVAVFKKSDWDAAMANSNFRLVGSIFNGKREQNGKISPEREGLKMDEENVLRWLQTILQEPNNYIEYIVQAPTDHCSGGGLRSRNYGYGS